MEKIHKIYILCFHANFNMKVQIVHVFMYFLHIVPTFTPITS